MYFYFPVFDMIGVRVLFFRQSLELFPGGHPPFLKHDADSVPHCVGGDVKPLSDLTVSEVLFQIPQDVTFPWGKGCSRPTPGRLPVPVQPGNRSAWRFPFHRQGEDGANAGLVLHKGHIHLVGNSQFQSRFHLPDGLVPVAQSVQGLGHVESGIYLG